MVWKTLGEDPPIVNVSSRYGAVGYNGAAIAGFNNIELITDRPLQLNLDEIKQVKRDWPDRARGGQPDGAVYRGRAGKRSWPRWRIPDATASS